MSAEWTAEAFEMEWRTGRGKHRHLHLTSPSGRRVQLVESPEGKVLHVSVDGAAWREVADR